MDPSLRREGSPKGMSKRDVKGLSGPTGSSSSLHASLNRKRWRLAIICIRFGVRMRRAVRKSSLTTLEFRLAKATYDLSGGINTSEKIREILQSVGLFCENFKETLSQVPFKEGKQLLFSSWVFLIEMMKREYLRAMRTDSDDAYVALGGTDDKKGCIETGLFRSVCQTFHLTIDLEKLIHGQNETGHSGSLDFYEFGNLFKAEAEDSTRDPFSDSAVMGRPEEYEAAYHPTRRTSFAVALIKSPTNYEVVPNKSPAAVSLLRNVAVLNMLSRKQTGRWKEGGVVEQSTSRFDAPSLGDSQHTPMTPSQQSLSIQERALEPKAPPPLYGHLSSRPQTAHAVPKMCHAVFNTSAPRLGGEVMPLRPARGPSQPVAARRHARDVATAQETKMMLTMPNTQTRVVKKKKAPRTASAAPRRVPSPVEDWEVFNPFSSVPSVLVMEAPAFWKPLGTL